MTVKEMVKLLITGKWTTSGNDVQYRVEKINDIIYVMFQWTESITDWKQNFKFWVKPYRNMPETWYVHKGFIENYKSVRDEVFAPIIESMGQYPIVVLGYSHGAALATLCYEDLLFNGYNAFSFVFGSPRVVWMPRKKIRNKFKGLLNYQVTGDIVTNVPFGIMGYRHVGKILKLGGFWPIPEVERHMIGNYLEYLDT